MSDIIQTLWIGERLSTVEKLCLSSFLAHGHEVHLYTYGEVKNVPDKVIINDANEILAEKYIFKTKGGSVACFADWFRWKMLYEKGGYWIDTDMVCLRKFDFTDEILFGCENQDLASIGVLKTSKGHPIAKLMSDSCEHPNRTHSYDKARIKARKCMRKYLMGNKRENIKFGESGGPRGFTAALKDHDLFHLAKPFTYFYAVTGMNWRCIFDETFKNGINCFDDTYAVHLWNELLRREGLDKDATFPAGSMIEQLKAKYL